MPLQHGRDEVYIRETKRNTNAIPAFSPRVLSISAGQGK